MERRFDLLGKIPKVERTPQGGLYAPAYLTRIGVFVYTRPDGSTIRELRHPDEVFASDSLATLRGAPLTVGHPAEPVTADNWKRLAVGHVADEVSADGRFVSADVRIQDASTVDAVERGDLVELSCGYECDVSFETGEYDGESYDAVQRGIRYNHVAIGPSDWGRAGPDVSLKLDGSYSLDMTTKVQRVDDAGGAAPAVAAPVNVVAVADYERTRGELDAAKAEIVSLKDQIAKATDPSTLDSKLQARFALHDSARKVLGSSANLVGKTDRDVMLATIASVRGDFKSDGKSDDFIRGVFEVVVSSAKESADSAAKLNTATVEAPAAHADGDKDNALEAAQKRNADRARNAWKASK